MGIAPKACIIKCYTHTNLNWDFHAFGTVRMDFNTTATDQGNGQCQFTNTTFSLANKVTIEMVLIEVMFVISLLKFLDIQR